MVERVEIEGAGPSGPTGPKDEEFARKGESLLAGGSPPPPVEEPKGEPLLAGKYKSLEDLEKAYLELQTRLGSKEPAKAEEKAAREVVGDDDFSAMQSEYAEGGSLSESTYKRLEERGISRKVVDSYIAGQQAIADRQVQEVYKAVGGEEEYQGLIQWASTSLDAEEIQTFNSEVQSGDLKRAKFAVRNLAARRQVEGRTPVRVQGKSGPPQGDVFRSMAEVVEAMKDRRYSKDPAYRADVEARIARSGPLR